MSEGPPTSGGGVDPQQPPPVQPAVPAGWYAHPTAPGWEAYWDGATWGAETRPAQPAAPVAQEPMTQEPVAQDPVAQEPVAQDPVAQEPVAQDPVAQEPVAQEPSTAVQPQAYQQETYEQPAYEQPVQAEPAITPAAAVPAAAVTAQPDAESRRSDSSLPLVLCMLGAIVAIVGSFLPAATSDLSDLVDIADDTLVAMGYGIAVIAAAVLGVVIAGYCYVRGSRTWLPILLGVAIVGIAVYVALAGLDDLAIEGIPAAPSGGAQVDSGATGAGLGALASGTVDGSPSTGIFAVGIGGLLMVLGGIGISRQPK